MKSKQKSRIRQIRRYRKSTVFGHLSFFKRSKNSENFGIYKPKENGRCEDDPMTTGMSKFPK